MLIKLSDLKFKIGYTDFDLKLRVAEFLRVCASSIKNITKIKQSIDSRNKQDVKMVVSIVVDVDDREKKLVKSGKYVQYEQKDNSIDTLISGINVKSKLRPVVVGSGPAGLFAALVLAKLKLKPMVIERGEIVENRIKSVQTFNVSSVLNTESNIQFGEGGAGTFSDGKLNTGVSSNMIETVLREFVSFGAYENILYDSKPHIGTDILVEIIKNIRNKIIELGGEVRFNTKLVDIKNSSGALESVTVLKNGVLEQIKTNQCILAIGHSARDTFEMLKRYLLIEPKPFSIGVRVEHLQEKISKAQYGEVYKKLPAAPYKLSCHLDNERSCYTFCMCPGGYVVAASSEEERIVTNGMSYNKRDGINANSALLVGITPKDFGSDDPLAGVEYQRKYESLAYKVSNSYKAPCQTFKDLKLNRATAAFGEVKPTYPIGVVGADLNVCLPKYVIDSIKKAMLVFDKKIKGFASDSAILTGVESRSSSPIRIVRDKEGQSSIKGLYPCGEGAGYAGGITSSAIDGIQQALNLVKNL